MDQTKRIGLLAVILLAASACTTVSTNNGCPDNELPPQGSSCSVEGQVCGVLDECGPMAVCDSGKWIVTDESPPGCDCGASCQGSCPATQPAHGSACSEEGAKCSYTDPSCGDAGADATCTGGVWDVSQYGPACLPFCPSTPPVEGTQCDGCCLATDCTYLDANGCPAHVACQNGVFTISAETCTPASTCASLSVDECSNANGCRWMTYAACPDTPQSFPQGCYPVADCTSDADCTSGGTCKAVEVDPCPGGDCGACTSEASICVP